MQLIDKAINHGHYCIVIAVPDLAFLHVNEPRNSIQKSNLVAALQENKKQLYMLELSEVSSCELKTVLNYAGEQNMIAAYVQFFSVFVAQSLLEEIVQFHYCFVQLSLSFTHRQSMLPLLEAAALLELSQTLIDFTSAEWPNDHLLAKEGPVYPTQLALVGILLHTVADIDKRKVVFLALTLDFLDLKNSGHPY